MHVLVCVQIYSFVRKDTSFLHFGYLKIPLVGNCSSCDDYDPGRQLPDVSMYHAFYFRFNCWDAKLYVEASFISQVTLVCILLCISIFVFNLGNIVITMLF